MGDPSLAELEREALACADEALRLGLEAALLEGDLAFFCVLAAHRCAVEQARTAALLKRGYV